MVYYNLVDRTTGAVLKTFEDTLDAEIALIESDREDLMVRRIEVKKPSVIAQLASWAIARLG